MRVLGIDPGAKGYIAQLEFRVDDIYLLRFDKLPKLDGENIKLLDSLVYDNMLAFHAFIEIPGTFTKNRTSLVRQHREYAEIRAALIANHISFTGVEAIKWKRHFKLIRRTKTDSVNLAKKLITGLDWDIKVGDHDLCEACLIAIYGYETSLKDVPF